MEELQQLQAARLKRLIETEGIDQKTLAKKLGVSTTSVNHWVNGKVHMNDYNAQLISNLFPGYSPEYLRGYAEYPDVRTQMVAEEWKRIHTQDAINGAVSDLVKHAGFEWGAVEFLQPVEGFTLYHLTRLSDGTVCEISQGQFDDCSNEICAYVEMRLNLMIERGRF